MEKIIIKSNDGAKAEIYLHGAHLCSWVPSNGTEQLFVSKTSAFQEGEAIRGGVPIIFPQFAGLGSLPKHGFARTAMWQCTSYGHHADGAAFAQFELRESIERLLLWPHIFQLQYQVTVRANELLLEMKVTNLGETAFSFTSAMHTYFKVDNLHQTQVHGLGGLSYRDTITNQNCIQDEAILKVNAEIDRIYANTQQAIVIAQAHQQLSLSQTGFSDAVVWNPGEEKGLQLKDLESDGYRHMLCVEAGAILQPITLAPGDVWSGSQTMRLLNNSSL